MTALRVGLPEIRKAIRVAANDSSRVTGLTHRLYKYPARFSPTFVSSAISAFSNPGDIVLDPYMGGGTTIVEAMATGRQAVGCDLNSLAVFISKVKTAVLSERELAAITHWALHVVPAIRYSDASIEAEEDMGDERTRNLHLPWVRPLKKFIALTVQSLSTLPSENSERFARCAILNVSQWALNGKKTKVSLETFRTRLAIRTLELLDESRTFRRKLAELETVHRPSLKHGSAAEIHKHSFWKRGQLADLVITSPPYPGIHVLYHRWQVDGRKERYLLQDY